MTLLKLLKNISAVLLFCTLSWQATSASALEIKEPKWGFNGQIRTDRFNILTVRVFNPSPEPFDGILELQRGSGILRTGEIMRESVYLGPGEERSVQFYPYISLQGAGDAWNLSWPKGSWSLSPPRESKPENGKIGIWLEDSKSITKGGAGLRTFDADLFPPFSTATDALQLVALDEAPRWDQPRRQALLEWLYRGGELHLFHGNNGDYPQFTGDLSLLNSPLEQQRIGQGLVIRHPQQRSNAGSLLETPKPPPGRSADLNLEYVQGNIDHQLQQQLRKTVDPQHLWSVIWVMAGIYLLCVFPGAYLIGKKTRDYRVVFALEFGAAILFSWGFSMVGRRGYNETSTNAAVATAQPVAPDTWDVSLTANVFVTSGGDYDLTHPGRGVLFSTGENNGERVRGYSRSGTDAVLHVDIPPFSSRLLRCKAQVKHPGLSLKLAANSEGPGAFELIPGENWPQDITVIHALQGESLYTLKLQGGRFVNVSNVPARTHIDRQTNFNPRFQPANPLGTPKETEEQIFGELYELLLKQAALNWLEDRATSPKSTTVRALVPAPIPEPFLVKNPLVGKSAGRVMYILDLSPSGAP